VEHILIILIGSSVTLTFSVLTHTILKRYLDFAFLPSFRALDSREQVVSTKNKAISYIKQKQSNTNTNHHE